MVAVLGGEILLEMTCAGEIFRVECSMLPVEQIDYAMSYRWQRIDGCELQEGDSPAGFVQTVREVPKSFWVDYINHLNDKKLIPYVIQHMGEVYCRTKVWPQYLLEVGDPALNITIASNPGFEGNLWDWDGKVSRLSVIHGICMLRAATRGWMWQELAFSRRPDKFPSVFGMLLYYLVVLGSDMFSHTLEIDSGWGWSTSSPKPSLLDTCTEALKKFVFQTLRAWHGFSDLVSTNAKFDTMKFICSEDFPPAELDHISRVLEAARQKLLENPASMVRSALSNMSNTNITKTDDLYNASFGVLLNKVGLSQASPEDQRAWIAHAAKAISSPSFPLEYSIAQLTPCPVSSLFGDILAWAVKKSPASLFQSGQFVLISRDGTAYLADSRPFFHPGSSVKHLKYRWKHLLRFQPRIAIAAHSYTVEGAVVRLSGATLMGPMQGGGVSPDSILGGREFAGIPERGQVLDNLKPLYGVQLSLQALMTRPRLKSMFDIMAWTKLETFRCQSSQNESSAMIMEPGLSHETDLISPGFPFEMKDGEFVEIVGGNVSGNSRGCRV